MNTKNLDIYVVDDDEAVRVSLLSKLGLRGNRVQVFRSGEDFLATADLERGGCVILDLRMSPGMSGEDVFDELLRRQSPLVVLFLSGHGTISMAVDATKRGAFGWVEKPFSENLMEKIDAALEVAIKLAAEHGPKQEARAKWGKLTPREKEVALLVASGLSNKLIAREMSCGSHEISDRTIEAHRAKGFSKLGLSSSPELDRFIRDNDL